MTVLLDNCVKKELAAHFTGHEVVHTSELGWSDLKNGQLLRQADLRFEILITIDKNMRFQSSLKGLRLRVVVFDVRDNLIEQLIPAVEALRPIIATLPEGEFTVIRP